MADPDDADGRRRAPDAPRLRRARHAQAEGRSDGADLAKVNRALAELDYVVVAEELPELDYDGPSPLPSHVERPNWWHRFFGVF